MPAHPFLKRLPRYQSAEQWRQIARNPSRFAPRAEDVQAPTSFVGPKAPVFSPHERRLLDTVLGNPDSDGPRRAYADLGGPRGEFIRTQLAIARELRAGDVPPVELFVREDQLLKTHESEWTAPLAEWGARDFVFRRGFIERLSLSGRSFISLGRTLFDFLPLRGVRLVAVKWYLDELAKTDHLARLTQLDLSGNRIGSASLATLIASPYSSQFTHLNLAANDLDDVSLSSLAELPLRQLSVAKNRLTRFDTASFPALESLDLSGNPMGPNALVDGKSLRQLNLSGCGIGTNLKSLGTQLREVDLSFNDLGDGTSLPDWINLHSLSLRGNRLTSFSNGAWPSLRRLDLGVNFLGDEFCLNVDDFPSLTSLDLTNVQLTERGLSTLLESGIVAGLMSLNLSWNRIGDVGVKMLADNSAASQLRTLDLSGTQIGIPGAKALLASAHLSHLREMRIGDCDGLPDSWRESLQDRFR
jgi:uncharacterized protein (TIGR02996 family)